jgi:hypothetical protein
MVCQNARHMLLGAKVVIDRSGNPEFVRRLEKKIKAETLDSRGTPLVNQVKMESSSSDSLVQLADMACGAIARSVSRSDMRYIKALEAGGREVRVDFWPT